MTDRLAGKVALVTGASSGIGAALARELHRRGAAVALVARRGDRLGTLAAELGERALAVVADVTRDGQLENAVTATVERFGRLDIAVANAGFGVSGPVEELTLADYRRQFETNVFGVLRTLYATLGALKTTRGTFVLVSSVMGHLSAPGSTPYSMSKFAVRALAEGLRGELRPTGVGVVLVSPGFVDSDIRRTDRFGVAHEHGRDDVPPWLRMSADTAARRIARAIAHRRREAIITLHGKLGVFIARHLPRTTAWLTGRPQRFPRARRHRQGDAG
jgi:short-subunit dehydrogenase